MSSVGATNPMTQTSGYTSLLPSNEFTNSALTTIQGIPSDSIALGSKALVTGILQGKSLVKFRSENHLSNDVMTKGGNLASSMGRVGLKAGLVSGIVSGIENSVKFVNGEITGSRIAGNVIADIGGGIMGGAVGAGVGGIASSLFRSATSTGTGIGGFVVGTLAFVGADLLYKNTGAHDFVSDNVTSFVDNLLEAGNNSGGW